MHDMKLLEATWLIPGADSTFIQVYIKGEMKQSKVGWGKVRQGPNVLVYLAVK